MGNLLTLAKWGPNTGRGYEPSPYVLPFVDNSTHEGASKKYRFNILHRRGESFRPSIMRGGYGPTLWGRPAFGQGDTMTAE